MRLGTYRRLARELGQCGTNLQELALVSECDQRGRGNPTLYKALSNIEEFLLRAEEAHVKVEPPKRIVTGQDFIDAGVKQGVRIKFLLQASQECEDNGMTDKDDIVNCVLSEDNPEEPCE